MFSKDSTFGHGIVAVRLARSISTTWSEEDGAEVLSVSIGTSRSIGSREYEGIGEILGVDVLCGLFDLLDGLTVVQGDVVSIGIAAEFESIDDIAVILSDVLVSSVLLSLVSRDGDRSAREPIAGRLDLDSAKSIWSSASDRRNGESKGESSDSSSSTDVGSCSSERSTSSCVDSNGDCSSTISNDHLPLEIHSRTSDPIGSRSSWSTSSSTRIRFGWLSVPWSR